MPMRALDFESRASANSAMGPEPLTGVEPVTGNLQGCCSPN